jgi:hypothetical protein
MTTKLLTPTKCVICHKPTLSKLDAYPYRIAKKAELNYCCEKCWETKVDETARTEKRRKRLDPKTFVPILTVEIK